MFARDRIKLDETLRRLESRSKTRHMLADIMFNTRTQVESFFEALQFDVERGSFECGDHPDDDMSRLSQLQSYQSLMAFLGSSLSDPSRDQQMIRSIMNTTTLQVQDSIKKYCTRVRGRRTTGSRSREVVSTSPGALEKIFDSAVVPMVSNLANHFVPVILAGTVAAGIRYSVLKGVIEQLMLDQVGNFFECPVNRQGLSYFNPCYWGPGRTVVSAFAYVLEKTGGATLQGLTVATNLSAIVLFIVLLIIFILVLIFTNSQMKFNVGLGFISGIQGNATPVPHRLASFRREDPMIEEISASPPGRERLRSPPRARRVRSPSRRVLALPAPPTPSQQDRILQLEQELEEERRRNQASLQMMQSVEGEIGSLLARRRTQSRPRA